ncbi:MAG: gluconate 2-dehydrogenase subunit 3 family protein [Candidatus Pseudobacter hemicellulosilyticus]|uniref:Gluconate 2-dehydrogenase subunit 3 family protein n=1 Tax=Candidatus Pseudobacter hemicellulosilyticus TaxID=3121375 RepID=A0AAJ5WRH0_9BACT|nr:MAG: gluconate 2-dehydrogenase subunit 3 family protein [Pseudobacter sp.]
MQRRKAIQVAGLLLGGAFVSINGLLSGCGQPGDTGFDEHTISLLDEIGETIIPATPASPGAKAAQVGLLMQAMVMDCYPKEQQDVFLKGIRSFRESVKATTKKDFEQLTVPEKEAILVEMDREAVTYNRDRHPGTPVHYYSMIKELTVWGYFTSEPGATKALRYVMIPGRYDAQLPYTKGEKAYAI